MAQRTTLLEPSIMPPLQALQTRSGRLGFVLSGSGTATLILFSGAGVTLEGWHALYPQIERIGKVFAWNRFGVDGSDPPRQPQTGMVILSSLQQLLAYTQLAPPYVLVAHSLGALYANLFARLHPQHVAGVLFLEARHPRECEGLRRHETRAARALSKLLALPQQMFRDNLHSEMQFASETVREIEAAGPFPAVPLLVVTGGNARPGMPDAARDARHAAQQELARLSPLGELVIASRSGHFPQVTQPQLVLELLRGLVARSLAAQAWNSIKP